MYAHQWRRAARSSESIARDAFVEDFMVCSKDCVVKIFSLCVIKFVCSNLFWDDKDASGNRSSGMHALRSARRCVQVNRGCNWGGENPQSGSTGGAQILQWSGGGAPENLVHLWIVWIFVFWKGRGRGFLMAKKKKSYAEGGISGVLVSADKREGASLWNTGVPHS